jgi:hypothetical protein
MTRPKTYVLYLFTELPQADGGDHERPKRVLECIRVFKEPSETQVMFLDKVHRWGSITKDMLDYDDVLDTDCECDTLEDFDGLQDLGAVRVRNTIVK